MRPALSLATVSAGALAVVPRRARRARRAGSLLWAALLALALGLSPQAFAAEVRNPKAEAKAEVSKAQLHYKLGRFEDALAAYTRAYELFNSPALLFNIGQCHKNLKNYERAIFFFEGYLREERSPEKRALAEELVESSRAELQRQRLEPPPPTAVATAPARPPSPEPAAAPLDGGATSPGPHAAPIPESFKEPVPPVVDLGPPPSPLPAPPPAITTKWWFWTALGAGVLAVAGGTLAYYATGTTTTVPPSGTLGTLDRR